jgi:hypothetical protein
MRHTLALALFLSACAPAPLDLVVGLSPEPAFVAFGVEVRSLEAASATLHIGEFRFLGENSTSLTSGIEGIALIASPVLGADETLTGELFPGQFDTFELSFLDTGIPQDDGSSISEGLGMDGSVDLDGDPLVRETPLTMTVPMNGIEFSAALRVEAEPREALAVKIEIDPGALLDGLDFSLLTLNAAGELVIDEENNNQALPVIQNNLATSLRVFVVE